MNSSPANILVVEDDAISAMALKDIIDEIGHSVTEHLTEGEQVLGSLEKKKADLILMDISLKGQMDGIDAAKQAWEKFKVPSIFLTAYSDEQFLARAKLAHPYGYVLKPYNPSDIKASLEMGLFRREEERPRGSVLKKGEIQERAQFDLGTKNLSCFDLLKRIDPFRELDAETLEAFASNCQLLDVAEKKLYVEEGQDHFPPFIVIKGRMALVKSSEAGKELVVSLLPAGDIFGVVLAIEDKPSPYTARAQVDSTILKLPYHGLRDLLAYNPGLYSEFTSYLMTRVEESHAFSKRLAHDRVEVRVAAGLLALITDFGQFDRGRQDYTLDITRLELADITGTTPETAIRTTKKMERDGILDLSTAGTIVILDVSKLESIVGA